MLYLFFFFLQVGLKGPEYVVTKVPVGEAPEKIVFKSGGGAKEEEADKSNKAKKPYLAYKDQVLLICYLIHVLAMDRTVCLDGAL